MFIFKILLIILIALPVIALSVYFYLQMLSFIKAKNAIEEEAIRQSAAESDNMKKRKKSGRKKKEKQR
jgi:flagellar basal body-associated protein FliL